MTKLPAAAVAACAMSASATATNLLANPGFETGSLAPWFAESGAPFVTNAEARTGVFSVSADQGDIIRQSFAPIPTNDITEVSFWTKRFGAAPSTFDYFFYYEDGTNDRQRVTLLGGADEWVQLPDLSAHLDADKNLIGFSLGRVSAGETFLDDFSIVPAPSALALFALAGLSAARRRR